MANVFAGSEIVEIGVQIEKNGKAFYDAVSARSRDPKAKETFKFLAGEEEKHITAFQKLLESVEKYDPQEAYTDDYHAYMKALAGDHVFTGKNIGAEAAKKANTDKEAIDMAIGFEKDSIVFYLEMKQMVLQHDARTIEALIAQEQSHLKRLLEVKKTIT